MPLVGVNNEPLLERAIFAYDGADYRVVKVDTDGNLVAAIKASQSIEVMQDTAADLKATVTIPTGQDIEARDYSWLGSTWQKSPMAFGYSDTYSERLIDTALAGGNVNLLGTAVPSGQVIVATNLSLRYDGTVPTRIAANYEWGSIGGFWAVASPASGVWYDRQGWWVLKEGHYFVASVVGSTLNDTLIYDISGFIMEVAE